MVPSGAGKGWGRHWGAFESLCCHCNTTKIDRVEQPVCGAEECRVVPGRGGADIGEPLNYSTTNCNTTKIDRVEQPRTVCGAEECRVVPGRGGADIGEPLNYSTTIAIPLGVPRSAEECRVALLPLKYHSNGKGRAAEDGLWYRGLPSGTV